MQTIVAISNNKCYLFDLYDHEIAKDFVFGETSENGEVHKHGDDGLRYSIYTVELFQDLVNLGVIEFDLLHDYIRFVQIDNE